MQFVAKFKLKKIEYFNWLTNDISKPHLQIIYYILPAEHFPPGELSELLDILEQDVSLLLLLHHPQSSTIDLRLLKSSMWKRKEMKGNFHSVPWPSPPWMEIMTYLGKFSLHFWTKDWIISDHFYGEWKTTIVLTPTWNGNVPTFHLPSPSLLHDLPLPVPPEVVLLVVLAGHHVLHWRVKCNTDNWETR